MSDGRKNFVHSKWAEMKQHSKKYHMFVKVSLFQMVGLSIVLTFFNDAIGNGFTRKVVFTGIIKMVCAYLLGVIIAYKEWDYCRNYTPLRKIMICCDC